MTTKKPTSFPTGVNPDLEARKACRVFSAVSLHFSDLSVGTYSGAATNINWLSRSLIDSLKMTTPERYSAVVPEEVF
ncbi:MAG: hypothetical protein QGG39_09470 [Candidatus Poribacteria bacterium]|nr:hypothetical protein [Candidatus Poribacteria bacterium]